MGSAMTVELRKLSAADIESLVAMESANQARPWTRGMFDDELSGENRVYLGAFGGNSLLAFAGMLLNGEEAHVTNLLVAPDQRRRGLARRLLVGLIDEALSGGAKHLTLEVRSRNEAGISLYRRFGLAPVGVRKGYYGDDDALVLWAYDIDSPEYAKRLEGLR
ncbi:MAG: ribosomal-protein-alanine N-acetyltransferase [Actinobacteria bacterium]|nr:MAG: ribosomal-protein-alanine N-acetyltransferase [Actinomycetota bacterium]